MLTNFEEIITETIRLEGGSKVHTVKGDPGGTTAFGLSQRTYPALDMHKVTLEDAVGIYKTDFWDTKALQFDKWPDQLKHIAFDFAVNGGPANSVRCAQKSANFATRYLDLDCKPLSGEKCAVDGRVGPNTFHAIQNIPQGLFRKFRWEYYENIMKKNPTLEKFRKGWMQRVLQV